MKLDEIKKILEAESQNEDSKLKEKYRLCDGENENIKSFFFPQTEKYLEFHRTGKGTEFSTVSQGEDTTKTKEKTNVIFGVRPCSLKAILLLDDVFLEEPVDPLYEEKRENSIIIASSCTELKSRCFCTSLGIDPYKPGKGDVMVDDATDEVVGLSSKGKEFLQEVFEHDEEKLAEIEELEQINAEDNKQEIKTDTQIEKEQETEEEIAKRIKDKMDKMKDSPLWDELSFRCLGCGVCTYYCPTCHCFDVCDYYKKDTGTRYRAWDSCMFSEFTKMAGGHNPRPTRKDRIKNRFYHKFSYLPELYQKIGCVGCGRCLVHCPVGISPLTLLREMGEIEDEDKSISTS